MNRQARQFDQPIDHRNTQQSPVRARFQAACSSSIAQLCKGLVDRAELKQLRVSWFSTHASSQSRILCAPVSLYPSFPTKTKRLFGQLPSWSTRSSRAPTLFEGLLLLVLQKHATAGDKHNTQPHLNFVPPQDRPRPCCFTRT